MQAVASVVSSGKFYWLLLDKENTESLMGMSLRGNKSVSLVLAALARNHTNWYWYGIKIAAFTFVKIILLQHTSWCCYNGLLILVQDKKVLVLYKIDSGNGSTLLYWHFSTKMMLLHYFVKPTLLLYRVIAVYWCWYSTKSILLVYQIIQSQWQINIGPVLNEVARVEKLFQMVLVLYSFVTGIT